MPTFEDADPPRDDRIAALGSPGRSRARPAQLGVTILALVLAYAVTAAASPVASHPVDLELAVASAVLGGLLLLASAIDLREHRLPDSINATLFLGALAVALPAGTDVVVWALISAAVGFAALWLVAYVYRRWQGRDGLGLGDAKLLGASGAWVGLEALPNVVLLASMAAIAVIVLAKLLRADFDHRRPIAFGPFLGWGVWAAWWWGG